MSSRFCSSTCRKADLRARRHREARPCSVLDCGRPVEVLARALCAGHYQRLITYGDPCAVPQRDKRDRPTIPVECTVCSTPFAASTARAMYCSQRCKDRGKAIKRGVVCAGGCGKILHGGRGSRPAGERICLACRRSRKDPEPDVLRPVTCGFCGGPFVSKRRNAGRWTRCCSKSCARKLERGSTWMGPGRDPVKRRAGFERSERARRARKAAVQSERYTLAEIAARDGFRCGLCRRKVDMARKHPDPRSPSVDHIVPLALGGDDLKINVALACLRCNLSKQHRVTYAQPLLFG